MAGSDATPEAARPGSAGGILGELSCFATHIGLKSGWVGCDFQNGRVLNPRWHVRRGTTPTSIYDATADPTDLLERVLREYCQPSPIAFGELKVDVRGHRAAFAEVTRSFKLDKEDEIEQFVRMFAPGPFAPV